MRRRRRCYSFDSPLRRQGIVEISGTEGTIVLPDPNMFSGGRPSPGRSVTVAPTRRTPPSPSSRGRMFRRRASWSAGASEPSTWRARSAPVARTARPARFGYHVLDTMVASQESAARGEFVPVDSTVDPIEAVPVDFDPFARTV